MGFDTGRCNRVRGVDCSGKAGSHLTATTVTGAEEEDVHADKIVIGTDQHQFLYVIEL